jgi:hypothetical protein
MRIDEVIPTVKPITAKTPEQVRVANLKQGVDRAKSALDTERERQQRSRATQALRRAQARMRAVTGSLNKIEAPQNER